MWKSITYKLQAYKYMKKEENLLKGKANLEIQTSDLDTLGQLEVFVNGPE